MLKTMEVSLQLKEWIMIFRVIFLLYSQHSNIINKNNKYLILKYKDTILILYANISMIKKLMIFKIHN